MRNVDMAGAQPRRRFFSTLDGIRGIASILIVLRHITTIFGSVNFQESYLAVDIFFVLSGVVLSNAYERRLQTGLSVVQFARIRWVRIYPLYIFGTILTLIAVWLGVDHDLAPGHLTLFLILALLLLPSPDVGQPLIFPLNPPAWSLFFELGVNVVYAAILRFLTMRMLAVIMLVSAIGLAVCLRLDSLHMLDLGWAPDTFPAGFFRVGYSFFAGVLLYRWFASKPSTVPASGRYAGLVPWAILALIAALLAAAPPDRIHSYFDFIAVTIIFPAIIYLALWFEPVGISARICKFFGAISYAIYAVHQPLAVLVSGVLKQAGGISVADYAPWSALAFFGFLVPFCWLLDKLYDAPVRRGLLGSHQINTWKRKFSRS